MDVKMWPYKCFKFYIVENTDNIDIPINKTNYTFDSYHNLDALLRIALSDCKRATFFIFMQMLRTCSVALQVF